MTLRLLPFVTIGLLSSVLSGHAAFSLVSDFNSLTGGGAALNGQGGWTTGGSNFTVASDPAGGANQVAQVTNAAAQPAYIGLGANSIANNTIGTIFYRTRRNGLVNISAGLSDVASPASPSNFADFEAQLNNQTTADFLGRNGGAFTTTIGPAGSPSGNFLDNTWINVWMVVNNTTDTYQIYLDTGSGQFLAQTAANLSTFTFRNSGAGAQPNALTTALFAGNTGAGTWFFDDIYVDNTGSNLANPIPEPAVPAMFGLVGLAMLARRRR